MQKNPYIARYIVPTILDISRTFPVLLITGARQVGKTTVLNHVSSTDTQARRYVSLDEFEIRSLAKRDPGLFIQQFKAPLTIDEIQYAPELLPYIKTAVDRDHTNGAYWLTGSQQFHMMRGVSESVAGRVGILNLLGLSLAEKTGLPYISDAWTPARIPGASHAPTDIARIFDHIVRGSFPRLSQPEPPSLDAFYGSHVQTYIDRALCA